MPRALNLQLPAEIPSLDLNGNMTSSPPPTARSFSPSSVAATDGDGTASRRTSFSSSGRTSSGGGPGSRSSSRSTSFTLPSDAREVIRLDGRQPGDEIECDEEMDEESAYPCFACCARRCVHRQGRPVGGPRRPPLWASAAAWDVRRLTAH